MSEDAGEINVYVCESCHGRIVTRNRDAGTTPFLIGCEATKGCHGLMHSLFYQVDQSQSPGFEWYKPTSTSERKKIREVERDHVAAGGLLLRSLAS